MSSRLAVFAVLFSSLLNAAHLSAQTVLLGTNSVLSSVDSDSSGEAEAFRITAANTGTVTSLSVYLDTANGARQVMVGIYSDYRGHPKTLLGSGTISSPIAGQWNTVAINPSVSVVTGTAYHETVLGVGGTIQYRDTNGGTHSESSLQTNLTALPTTWSSGPSWPSAPISFYASGSTNSNGSNGGVSITIAPTSASVGIGGTQQFTATVTGSNNTGVNWSVIAGGGSVNSSGFYTAPSAPGSATVQAQSQADTTKTATAAVTITSSVGVSIFPTTAAVPQGGTQQFTAKVSGSSNTNVVWSLSGVGTLSSSGLYTAPATQGSATVTATSMADSTKSASANVSVPQVSISVSPVSATVQPRGTQQFTATVSGTTNTGVTWSENGNGSVNGNGLYTAPNTGENDTVTATSVADSTKGASASVTVSNLDQSQCGITLNWTSSACQQIGQGQLNTAIVNRVNDPHAWAVISRHGEYAQSESECNHPKAVSVVNNSLVINISATPTNCGDFHVDGTVRNSATSWPYLTGDVQFNTFNFKYGTIIVTQKLPPPNTNTWPGSFWLLNANCQNDNKYSGDTGEGGCTPQGTVPYTEIDPNECYRASEGGWCQFHVANPSFNMGGGCDVSYPVDSNGIPAVHTFMTIWSPSGIKQFMDGTQVANCGMNLTQPMFLIAQIQTGGNSGTPNNSALPASLTIYSVKICSTTDGSCATVHDNDPSVEFIDRFGGAPQ